MNKNIYIPAILLLTTILSCNGGGARVGLQSPPLALDRVGGGAVDLSQLKGKVVLVNFWATWCEPCKAEMPDFDKLYRKMEGKPFELLAVSVDLMDDKVEKMTKDMKLSFPILRDSNGKVSRAWGASIYPESFLIGPDGMIVEKYIGVQPWTSDEMIQTFEKLMPK